MTNPVIFHNDPRYLASKFIEVAGNSRDNFLYLTASEISSLNFVSNTPILCYDITNNQWVTYYQGATTVIGSGGSSNHDLLSNLQGGAPGEYFHLSNAQYTKLNIGNFQSNWNALTNSPPMPVAGPTNKDQFYRVSTAGTTTIDGISTWKVGDWIWSTGTTWIRMATGASGDNLDTLPITLDGQTIFALSQLPINMNTSRLFLNGAKQKFGIDYSIAGAVLTWLSSIITLKTSDTLELYYI